MLLADIAVKFALALVTVAAVALPFTTHAAPTSDSLEIDIGALAEIDAALKNGTLAGALHAISPPSPLQGLGALSRSAQSHIEALDNSEAMLDML
ncbi:hypothetical protein EV182_004197 [Spiromyces aspiralis]|uniref:Uncharacterized protein n=1 Tax=Spiromyces aspiralis TaxID=68401 RepID=A0ACC1HBN4_9FUNG|nr:hypothetical protein EV182_004197 [Spiromyces aspiralis]